jgi:hypothetical protein
MIQRKKKRKNYKKRKQKKDQKLKPKKKKKRRGKNRESHELKTKGEKLVVSSWLELIKLLIPLPLPPRNYHYSQAKYK